MDPGDTLVGVDDPVFSDAVTRVEWRLESLIVGEARGGNLDDEMGFAGVELSESGRRFPEQLLGKDGDIRLEQERICQAQGRFDANGQVIGQSADECNVEC